MKDQASKESKASSRMSYGACDIYGGGAFVVISTFYTVFLTKALGMPPALAGMIPLIGKVWDAVTDPIMGNIADRTVSKFGPKRFWILVGSIISALTFVVMWIPFKAGGNTTAQFIFYMLMYMLFSTGFTIVMVPYNGLLPDMVDDYTVRAKFSSTRMIFSALGAIIAGLIPTLMIKDNTNAGQYLTVALIFAVVFLVTILITFFGTWEHHKPAQKVSMGETFTQSFTVFKSRSFRLFIAIFIFGQCAADFITGLAVYYVDDVLNAYGGGNFTILMGVLLVAQLEHLVRVPQTVHIKMIQRHPSAVILVDYGEGGAGDGFLDAKSLGDGLRQGRLPGAEVAHKGIDHAGDRFHGQLFAQGPHLFFSFDDHGNSVS